MQVTNVPPDLVTSQEEIIRRRALVEEEARELREEEMRLQKQLNECRNRANGCEQTSEHRLLLQASEWRNDSLGTTAMCALAYMQKLFSCAL